MLRCNKNYVEINVFWDYTGLALRNLQSVRGEAVSTLLLRMRTRSARTSVWLFNIGVTSSPPFPTCQMIESLEHLLDVCAVHSVPRDSLLIHPSVDVHAQLPSKIIFPKGNVHRHRLVQRALIAFFFKRLALLVGCRASLVAWFAMFWDLRPGIAWMFFFLCVCLSKLQFNVVYSFLSEFFLTFVLFY